ncbi:hypothetical protein FOMA001_g4863 [Fusarium oxysporum f. sp. matthiolae]|nr:hypothetical protein FOMA001_g4863 [Fusarium oxysporum f. sp. matthiolae]
MSGLEERLANIEALLSALGGLRVPETQPGLDISLSDIGVSGSSNSWGISPIQTSLDVAHCQHTAISNAGSQLTKAASSDQLELAPLSEVLPLVDNYFRNYNTIIPLLEENVFMRMLLDWYSSSTKRSTVAWAAINVVLAINYRVLEGKTMDDPAFSQSIRNVRSVMSELMMQSQDLMGLQVLLGMVILFQGSSEVQLAIVLTGSVIRLAQSLRLNSKKALAGLSKSKQAHRTRLFWLTYIYDREMAQRSQCPYHQPDCETDIDLPEANPEENLGIITSSTDTIRFNYLRSCAKFAFIQGKAHDLLYSQKSHTFTPERKARSIALIEELLKEWVDEIPPELRTREGIDERLSPLARDMMANLWSRHIETRIKIHSIFTFEDTWINRVRRYLSPAVIDVSDDVDGEVRRADLTPLPAGWDECVGNGRVCLELISSAKLTEYILWQLQQVREHERNTLRSVINVDAFREAQMLLSAHRHLPLNFVTWPEYQALLTAVNPAVQEFLTDSGNTVAADLDRAYDAHQQSVKKWLEHARSLVHIAMDVWSSPQRKAYVAVHAQWVDEAYKPRKALLGLPNLRRSHAGAAMTPHLMEIIRKYHLAPLNRVLHWGQ